jgi:YbgC/YbaW family acyl-CoA thioester hydrolase
MTDPVFITRQVLFGDCDPEGIVYTPRFSYFAVEAIHDALSIWLKKPGLRALMDFGILPPARAFSIEFLHPVTWDDELNIKVKVVNLGVHSFTFSVEGFIGKDIAAFSASLTQVCVSPETKKRVAVPEQLRLMLQ